jgi:hypothetical protein
VGPSARDDHANGLPKSTEVLTKAKSGVNQKISEQDRVSELSELSLLVLVVVRENCVLDRFDERSRV